MSSSSSFLFLNECTCFIILSNAQLIEKWPFSCFSSFSEKRRMFLPSLPSTPHVDSLHVPFAHESIIGQIIVNKGEEKKEEKEKPHLKFL